MPPADGFAALFRASVARVVDFTNYMLASMQAFSNMETPIEKAPAHYYWLESPCGCYIACHVRKCVGVTVAYVGYKRVVVALLFILLAWNIVCD